MSVKGYKVFNPDWTCRGFQYEVGKTFLHIGNIEMCSAGFHFCQKANDCFGYYSFNSKNKVAEVEAVGFVETDGDKSVTNEIRIVREISWQELLDLVNTGDGCTGRSNSGDWNSGDWNSTDFSAGFFNSQEPKIMMFNKPTELSRSCILKYKGIRLLNQNYENQVWISSSDMTSEEKSKHPEHKTTGGYLKTLDFKTACKTMWDKLGKDDRQSVMDLPNFDSDVFEEITGIVVKEG